MTALAEHRAAAVASVTDSFIDLQRTVRRSKARLLAAAGTTFRTWTCPRSRKQLSKTS